MGKYFEKDRLQIVKILKVSRRETAKSDKVQMRVKRKKYDEKKYCIKIQN